MSFNRLRYEEDATELSLDRSTRPGDYELFHPKFYRNNECLSTLGPNNARNQPSDTREFFNDLGSIVDAETDITNRRNPLTHSNKYGMNQDYLKHKVNNKPICENYMNTEDSRFTNPLINYRGMTTFSYQTHPHLPVNPQCHIQQFSHRSGTSSRLLVRDCFQEQIIEPNQNTYMGPVQQPEEPVKKCTYTCINETPTV